MVVFINDNIMNIKKILLNITSVFKSKNFNNSLIKK